MTYHVDLTGIVSLDELRPHSGSLMLSRMFVGRAWTMAGPIWPLAMNFVRLADLAVNEYQAGYADTLDYWHPDQEGLSLGIVPASGHFETCLTAAHRAILHCQRLRRQSDIAPGLRARLPTKAKVLSSNGDETLREFRHLIQHLEERILGLKESAIGDGMAALMVRGDERIEGMATILALDRLDVGGLRLPLATLAGWLRELHDIAKKVAEYPGEP